MTVMLVTYDLRAPGRNYQPLWDYLKTFTYCKGLESVWLIETTATTEAVRDRLKQLVDSNDRVLVVQITKDAYWNSFNYTCGEWLNSPSRRW